MTKIVVSGDWHLDASTAGVSRFDDLKSAMLELGQYVLEQGADVFVFLGDLANPDGGSIVLRAVTAALIFAKSLEDAGVKTIWIPGNHDVVDDSVGRSTLSPLSVIARVCEPDPAIVTVKDTDLLLLPYPPRTMRYDPEKSARTLLEPRDQTRKLLTFGHLTIEGAQLGSESRELARGSDVLYPLVVLREFKPIAQFNGHYHARQLCHGVVMPGTLERLRFDEERNIPGWVSIEV